MNDNISPTEREKEDFWLEIGPKSAYYGTDSYETAEENGDASPDAERLGWSGAEPETERGLENLAAPPDEAVPVVTPELKALEWLDDVPIEDR